MDDDTEDEHSQKLLEFFEQRQRQLDQMSREEESEAQEDVDEMQLDSERLRSLQERLNSMAGPVPEDHESRNDIRNGSDEEDEGAYEPVGR